MTKYTGLIRILAGLILTSAVSFALIPQINIAKSIRGTATPENKPVSLEKSLVKTTVPKPPDPPGDQMQDYKDWVDAGMPGYIPDPGSVKNGNEAEIVKPVVVSVQVECQREPASALGLSANAATVYETVCALFPEVTSFGGLRVGDPMDHGSGNAIDCMIDSVNGDKLAQWLLDHWSELPLKYIIWEQRISYGGEWQWMEDRGSPTQNHYDHVHISVN